MCPCPVSPEDCSLSDEKGYMYTQPCSVLGCLGLAWMGRQSPPNHGGGQEKLGCWGGGGREGIHPLIQMFPSSSHSVPDI